MMTRDPSGTRTNTPLNKKGVVVNYYCLENDDGYWLDIMVDGLLYDRVGPFDTPDECVNAKNFLMAQCIADGGEDITDKMTIN